MHPASTKMDRPFGRILGLLLLLAAAIGTDAFIVRQQQQLPPRRSAPHGGAVAAAGRGRAWQVSGATTTMVGPSRSGPTRLFNTFGSRRSALTGSSNSPPNASSHMTEGHDEHGRAALRRHGR